MSESSSNNLSVVCEHDWEYLGYDHRGSHKGEDCYECRKCGVYEYIQEGKELPKSSPIVHKVKSAETSPNATNNAPLHTTAVPGSGILAVPQIKTFPNSSNKGWECPKCHRVWAPYVQGCGNCNSSITTHQASGYAPITK